MRWNDTNGVRVDGVDGVRPGSDPGLTPSTPSTLTPFVSFPFISPQLFFQPMTTHELIDITIIGAGPTGLFAQFYAGMRGVTSRIVDALPELGGQLKALYPEKLIFDVGGFPSVLAKDLVSQLAAQAGQFGAKTHLGERVVALEQENGHFV